MDVYSWTIIAIFVVGYLLIAFEHQLRINKATSALMMGVLMWVLVFFHQHGVEKLQIFGHHLSDIAQVVLFFIGVLAIVEIMNSHQGFNLIARALTFKSMKKMFVALGLITFFLSSILGSITCTIVMCAIINRLTGVSEDRKYLGMGVVLAANAGGAFSPIGDITTTMLWIGGQLSTFRMIREIFWPSFVCMVLSLAICLPLLKGEVQFSKDYFAEKVDPKNLFVFFMGLLLLLFVPVFKIITDLPPFMGVLFGLSILWLITDLLHHGEKEELMVPFILPKVDLTGPIFFLGILLAIVAMEADGILSLLAKTLDQVVGSVGWIAFGIGLLSAVIDNVPLVAGAMGMYSLSQFPQDHTFWQLLAYAAGVGGSIFIFGSAPGVAYMSLQEVDFFWYLKRASLPALIGYIGGFLVYWI